MTSNRKAILDAAKAMDEGDVKPAVSLGLQGAGAYRVKNYATGEKKYFAKMLNLLTQEDRPSLKKFRHARAATEYGHKLAERFARFIEARKEQDTSNETLT